MSGSPLPRPQCPRFRSALNDDFPENFFLRPLHVRGREAVRAYVRSLGNEAREWLLALYVDEEFQLTAVETIARGDVSSCDVPFWDLIHCGRQLRATGFILVHNHPSGDPRPSQADIRITARLADVSRALDMPLLDHFIVAGEEMTSVGFWGPDD